MSDVEQKIINETAKQFSIDASELLNYSGETHITTAFEIACYLLRTNLNCSLSGISSIFVNQSIGDVLEAIKHIESQIS